MVIPTPAVLLVDLKWFKDNQGALQALSGLFSVVNVGFLTAFGIWKVRHDGRTHKNSLKNTDIQIATSRHQRFTWAVEKLEAKAPHVGLASARTIQRIASEYPAEYRSDAIKILCFYLTTYPISESSLSARLDRQIALESLLSLLKESDSADLKGARLQELAWPKSPDRPTLNLDLTGANLSQCDLRNVDLTQSSIHSAYFAGSRLPRRNHLPREIRDSVFTSATDFTVAFAPDPDSVLVSGHPAFDSCTLKSCNFGGCDLRHVVFCACDLTGTSLF